MAVALQLVDSLLNTVYLGRYRIEELRGEGRHAVVYRAYDMVRRGEVALKLYGEDSLDHQAAEAAEQHQLQDSPGVMPLYDVHPGALPYEATAMPLAAQTLADAVPLSAAATKQQMLRILNALRFCHGRGVVHGDIKPANCFIDRFGHAQLGDFGVCDFLPGGRRGHTLEYAAPELLDNRPRSSATDVWAAFVMAYELFCGEMPFGSTADDPEDVLATRILAGGFPPIAAHRPFLPRRLQRLFEAAFGIEPETRRLTGAELAHNELANVPVRADWVRVKRANTIERWEGVERGPDGERTGVELEAELIHLPRAGRYEADVRLRRPNRRAQRIPGTRVCRNTSEARTRQCMYSKMRAVTEARRPS